MCDCLFIELSREHRVIARRLATLPPGVIEWQQLSTNNAESVG